MSADPRRIILASRSPRRYEILSNLGFLPVVAPADVPEERGHGESPLDYVLRLAAEKAAATAALGIPSHTPGVSPWVLAADTIVVLDDQVLEKPDSEEDAVAMLLRLSGQKHGVITAVAVHHVEDRRVEVRTVSSDVWFATLDPDTIERYVATGVPMDKAGAYGIQGLAGAFVSRIDGSYSNIVGLPVHETVVLLRDVGAIDHFPFHQKLSG